jgi:putative transcriptional regulator
MSNGRFFKKLKRAMDEVVAYKRGELDLQKETIEIPEPPAEYKPQQIKKIREVGHYTQGTFAKVLNVSIKTVQSWESGQRVPSQAALRLLEVVDKGLYRPQIVRIDRGTGRNR